MTVETQCPTCETVYQRLGAHWSRADDKESSPCGFKEPTQRQKELMTGLLMSDAWLEKSGSQSNPMFRVEMIVTEFIEWVAGELAPFTSNLNDRGRSGQENEQGYGQSQHDTRELSTISHPWLNTLNEWYKTGEKTFPADLDMTPLVFKMLYAGDGYLKWSSSGGCRLAIACASRANRELISRNLDDLGVEHTVNHREGDDRGSVIVSTADTPDMFEWMGEAPPGFEYKWETDDRDRYYRLKHRSTADN